MHEGRRPPGDIFGTEEARVKKSLSPIFVIIVVLMALALGGLYFMVRYRAHQTQWEAESRALQTQRDRAMRSGRSRAGRRPSGGRTGSDASPRSGVAQSAPESGSQPEAP